MCIFMNSTSLDFIIIDAKASAFYDNFGLVS